MAQTVTVETLALAARRKAKLENASAVSDDEVLAAINHAVLQYYDTVNSSSYAYNRSSTTLSSVTASSTVTNFYKALGVYRVLQGTEVYHIDPLDESRRTWVEPNTDIINVIVEFIPSFTDLVAGDSFTYIGPGRQFVEYSVTAIILESVNRDGRFWQALANEARADLAKFADRQPTVGYPLPVEMPRGFPFYTMDDGRTYFYRFEGYDTITFWRTRQSGFLLPPGNF